MKNKTLFLCLTAESDKSAALELVLNDANNALRFEIETESFSLVTGSPFAYWISDSTRRCFQSLHPFESNERIARAGLQTSDDRRFLRCHWEIGHCNIDERFFCFSKGGAHASYYADIHLLINWNKDGEELKTWASYSQGGGHWTRNIRSTDCYFLPGLTWPIKNRFSFKPRALPPGSIFANIGAAAFFSGNSRIEAFWAIMSSQAFTGLARLTAGWNFEAGVIQRTPVPPLSNLDSDHLSDMSIRIWKIKQDLDQSEETSHIFLLPALLQADGPTLASRASTWSQKVQTLEADIIQTQCQIDEYCWNLYNISKEDQQALTGLGVSLDESGENEAEFDEESEIETSVPISPDILAEDLTSWLFGAALGRWDTRFASGEKSASPLRGPFDKLPPVSRGMLLGTDGLHPAKNATGRFMPEHDLLVDDEGENLDLVRRVREVLERVAGERADGWLLELESMLGADLRTWYRRTFFERHLKRYSKSRRKAPIYWQLGTPSGSYSVWLYYPRLTRDSLFRLLNDVVKPKVAYEEERLAGLREQNARRSELEPQEALVEELQAFRDEVARVTPLFDPNLDDGVLINAAPLHRLFVHAGWRRDTHAAWTQLVRGDFEWSHMALHLWPERVIPQCAEQRHLALAHDLEGPLKTRSAEDLVAAHTRPAVKDALQALLNASPQAVGRSAGRPGRAPRAPRPAQEPRAAAEPTPLAPRASAEVPEATLVAIREVLARFPGGAAKSDVLSATGIPDGTWNTAIAQLLVTGDVERQGEKRGTRYFLVRR